MVGLIFAKAFFPSNPAPITISAKGVAMEAILLMVLSINTGNSRCSNEVAAPNTIPIMIGFLQMFLNAFLIFLSSSFDASNVSTITE